MEIATKRILSTILCLSVLLAMLLVPVSAASAGKEGRGVRAEAVKN